AYRLLQVRRLFDVTADAAEGFDHLFVARVVQQAGRRRRDAGLVAAIDAVVVEDHGSHRQLVAADRLDLHAAEAEGAVAFDGDDRLAADRGGADGIAHADTHDAPG